MRDWSISPKFPHGHGDGDRSYDPVISPIRSLPTLIRRRRRRWILSPFDFPISISERRNSNWSAWMKLTSGWMVILGFQMVPALLLLHLLLRILGVWRPWFLVLWSLQESNSVGRCSSPFWRRIFRYLSQDFFFLFDSKNLIFVGLMCMNSKCGKIGNRR